MATKIESTHEVFIAETKRMQDAREAETLRMVQEIQASKPTLIVRNPRSNAGARISKGVGAVAKFKARGEFMGWYRSNQKSGRPSRLMPIENEINVAFEAWATAIRKSVPQHIHASFLGKRSGASRLKKSKDSQIVAMNAVLQKMNKPVIPRKIAAELNLSIEHVRRVFRKIRSQKSP